MIEELEQLNSELEKTNEKLSLALDNAEQENENLKKIEKKYQRINGELREENKDLQQRIENSIDFINGGKGWRKLRYTHQEKMLLNILKGSDKE